MKTVTKGLRKPHIAVLAAVLALIAGICTFFCAGAQQSAWAEESGKTIFTSESISNLPFEKTDNGLTVKIFLKDKGDDEATTTEGEGEDSKDTKDAQGNTPGNTEGNTSPDTPDAAKVLTVEITADKDIEAAKVVVKIADDKEVTKEIPNKMLKKNEAFTFTLDDCTEASELTIYGPEEKQEADKSDNSKGTQDSQSVDGNTSDTESGNSQDGTTDKPAGSNTNPSDTQSNTGTTSGEPVPPASDEPVSPASVDDSKYKVTFDSNGHGEAPAAITDIPKDSTIDLSQKSIAAEGYRFTGWYTDSKCTILFDETTPITSDITLYAGWVKQVTVTYDLGEHGGSKAADTVDQGTPVPMFEDPTEEGWTFERWIMDDDESFLPGETPVTQDMTVHAVWVEKIPLDKSKSIAVDQNSTDADTFDIIITKVNVENGTCLEGAEFTLKDKNDKVIGSWTSGNSGVLVENLRQDTTYVLYETKAPSGYGVEKPININYTVENGKAVVKIDQGGSVIVPLATNNDGIATLNVKDAAGKSKTSSTTMPKTGDSQDLPLVGLCLGGAAVLAAGIAFIAYRKRKLA
ncbi:MAG: InlB B-repeat-containing protein [Eggerthellaceae bacterium]